MEKKEKILHIVPIIDTEGPTTGHPDMIDTWDSLSQAIDKLTGEIRTSLKDSYGNPLVINWFMLDWTGYSKNDAEFKRRGHDTRLHAVWNFYKDKFLSDKQILKTNDGMYWHYHHPPLDGSWGWNKNWNDSNWYEYILGKLILDQSYFPSAYRAGKYVENNESSYWLEKWIPFDYSNISPIKREFCDWSEATIAWEPYHPSVENYQLSGSMKRLVARSLPVAAKGGSGILDIKEIEKAFDEVKAGKNAIFSFHTHDYYKSINEEFISAHKMIEEVSQKKGVKWKYSNSIEALRSCLDFVLPDLKLEISEKEKREFKLAFNHDLFCEEPFVVVEYEDGKTLRVKTESENRSIFHVKLDAKVKRWGVGANDAYGNCVVVNKVI